MDKNFIPYKENVDLLRAGFSFKAIDEPWFNTHSTVNHPSLQPGILIGVNPIEPLMKSQMHKIAVWNIPAPLYQQAFRWFRKEHNLTFTIKKHFNCYNLVEVLRYIPESDSNKQVKLKGLDFKDCGSYEEAEIATLRFLISKIKDKK